MRNVALALCLSIALFGCPKKKTDAGDAGDAATDAAVAEVDSGPAAPEASNVNEVARFGDETKIDREAAKTAAPLTIARKSPPNGEIVARLSKGADVTKLASHEGQILIVFVNPKKADDHLMGWVAESAFKAAAAAATKCKTDKECGAGQVCIPHEAGTKCEKACGAGNTAACPQNYDCKGEGPNAEGKTVQYCTSTLPAPTGKDAGAPAKADGGK